MRLDTRTILFVISLVSFTNAMAMFIGWRTYLRQRQMAWWLASSFSLTLGICLLTLRGLVPDVVPVVFGNFAVLISMGTLLIGCELSVDARPSWRGAGSLLGVLAAVHLYFFFGFDSFLARTVVMSIASAAFPLASARVLFRAQRQPSTSTRFIAAGLLFLIGGAQALRGILALRGATPTDLVGDNVAVTVNLTLALMLWLLLSFVSMVMTGERLQEETRVARAALDASTQAGLQALRRSEERFSLAVEGSNAGIWDWDVASNTFFLSALGKSLLGYADDEAEGSYERWFQLLHPDDSPRAVQTIRQYLRSGQSELVLEHRLRHRDGTYRWMLGRGAARRDAALRVYRIAGSIEDITERRTTEDAQEFLARHAHLGLGEDFFDSLCRYLLQALSADAVFFDRLSADGSSAVVEASCTIGVIGVPAVRELEGSAVGECVKEGNWSMLRGVRERFPTDARLRAVGAEACVGTTLRMTNGQPIGVITVVTRTPLADSRTAELLLSLFAVPASGELIRKQADEALRRREEYSRHLLTSLPAGVVVHSPDTAVLDCNAMASAMMGLTLDQMRGRTAVDPSWSFVREDRTTMTLDEYPVRRVAATGAPVSGLVVGMQVPGRGDVTWAVCNAYPIDDDDGALSQIVVTFVDVTERIRSEEARAQLESQLRQSQKMEAVGQLAGGIAHDFNNLLTVITGIADVAARSLSPEDPFRRDLTDIQRAGQRAAVLTRQLLAFGRKQTIAPEILNLGVLIDDLQPLLTRVIRENIRLELRACRGPCEVLADPGQIEQVLLNLALNARDAMPHGGTLTFELSETTLDPAFVRSHPGVRPGPHVRMNVRDTGVGMDESTRARVFEPFYTTKAPGQGTGLGLATVYGIVSQSRGAIEVVSAPGQGTTFSVYLPLVRGASHAGEGSALRVRTPRDTPSVPMYEVSEEAFSGTGSILVVEDEGAIRRLAQRILQSAGYTVLTACDGVDALRVLEERGSAVDLLLTDVIMPNMGGPELAKRLSELHPSTKVLYASGYAGDAELRLNAIGESSNFLGKPYQVVELTRKVREIMATGKA